jgi:arsenite oxidase small subunit
MGSSTPRYFTLDELRNYDGKGGGPTYLIYKGKVYDISGSKLWTKGTHMRVHDSRENLDETIKKAPHGDEVLSRFPIVGELKVEVLGEKKESESGKAVTLLQNPAPIASSKPPEATPMVPSEEAGEAPSSKERRDFLKVVVTAGGAITLFALLSALKPLSFIPPVTTSSSWPRILVGNAQNLQLLTPVTFNYPLTNTPNFLIKLGVKAASGVGPDGDIVAFSGICQHLGCFWGFLAPGASPTCNTSFKAQIPQGYCCCHGSQYDLTNNGKVIGGPAPHPLPQVVLEYDQSTGDIYATSMTAPTIYGHGPAGTTDPSLVLQYDLSGGTVVSS